MILPKTAAKVCKPLGKAIFFCKKHSPAILTGLGVAGYAGSVYFASKAGPKAERAQAEYLKDKDRKKFIKGYVKAWGPSIGLFCVSTASVVGGHKILRGRYLATGAALEATRRAFAKYRERVVAKEGEEADLAYRHGFKEKVDILPGEGEGLGTVVHETVAEEAVDKSDYYIQIFDERNQLYVEGDLRGNICRLKERKMELNILLDASIDDMMTYREVLIRTGFKYALKDPDLAQFAGRTGWKRGGEGDDYISFGPMFEKLLSDTAYYNDYLMGRTPPLILEFNCDGAIYK